MTKKQIKRLIVEAYKLREDAENMLRELMRFQGILRELLRMLSREKK
jgi:hypothetical protein